MQSCFGPCKWLNSTTSNRSSTIRLYFCLLNVPAPTVWFISSPVLHSRQAEPNIWPTSSICQMHAHYWLIGIYFKNLSSHTYATKNTSNLWNNNCSCHLHLCKLQEKQMKKHEVMNFHIRPSSKVICLRGLYWFPTRNSALLNKIPFFDNFFQRWHKSSNHRSSFLKLRHKFIINSLLLIFCSQAKDQS